MEIAKQVCIWSTIWGPKPRGLEGMCFWSISSRNAWSCQVTATMTISCSPPRLGFRKAYQGTTSTQKFKPCANNAARFFFGFCYALLRDSYIPFKSCQIYSSNVLSLSIFRDITIEILSDKPVGSFVVRQSRSTPESLALSLRIPAGSISHYLIQTSVSSDNQIYYQIKVQFLNRNFGWKSLNLLSFNFVGLKKTVWFFGIIGNSPFSHAWKPALCPLDWTSSSRMEK